MPTKDGTIGEGVGTGHSTMGYHYILVTEPKLALNQWFLLLNLNPKKKKKFRPLFRPCARFLYIISAFIYCLAVFMSRVGLGRLIQA